MNFTMMHGSTNFNHWGNFDFRNWLASVHLPERSYI